MSISFEKRNLTIQILMILFRETDIDHPISQTRFHRQLLTYYGTKIDPKTLRSHLRDLRDTGVPIVQCSGGWYYEHDFSASEVHMLIDSLPRGLSPAEHDDIALRLSHLCSRYFSRELYINAQNDQADLLNTIELLDTAIHQNKKIRFHYGQYGIDKQLHIKTNADDSPHIYIRSPYKTVVQNGKYYLLCGSEKYHEISHFRIDRIRSCEIIPDSFRIPISSMLNSCEELTAYLQARPYMYAGPLSKTCFRVPISFLSSVFDTFGQEVDLIPDENDKVLVYTEASLQGMKTFAMHYCEQVEILKPESLRKDIADTHRRLFEKYRS